jgi:hypothetical protein
MSTNDLHMIVGNDLAFAVLLSLLEPYHLLEGTPACQSRWKARSQNFDQIKDPLCIG